METFANYIKIAVSILVVVNPIGNSPIFLSVTEDQNEKQRNKTAFTTALAVAITLICSVFFGERILKLFGIDIPAFQVGAGILILLMAISMLHAKVTGSKHTPEEAKEAEEKENVAIVPLAIPLMAGPGAMSTVILCSNQSTQWEHKILLVLIVILISVFVWISLRMSTVIGKVIGKTGINIATRLMGLILAAIAVEFISKGLKVLLPGLS
ncbi:UPF0056 inner membrane protein YchE [hydrothermal vent metagenome]|uniref:UPF0056 inner membrane protein YchE n=1 Tax=hydrothermal vent metagenome TaxID=652676 RepID=A0A3B1DV88_9ZZZZ